MKRNRIQIFLPIAISFFLLVYPFYLRCPYFAEANVFPTDLGFENPDQDDQFVDQQQEGSKAFVLAFFPLGSHRIPMSSGTLPFSFLKHIPSIKKASSFAVEKTYLLYFQQLPGGYDEKKFGKDPHKGSVRGAMALGGERRDDYKPENLSCFHIA